MSAQIKKFHHNFIICAIHCGVLVCSWYICKTLNSRNMTICQELDYSVALQAKIVQGTPGTFLSRQNTKNHGYHGPIANYPALTQEHFKIPQHSDTVTITPEGHMWHYSSIIRRWNNNHLSTSLITNQCQASAISRVVYMNKYLTSCYVCDFVPDFSHPIMILETRWSYNKIKCYLSDLALVFNVSRSPRQLNWVNGVSATTLGYRGHPAPPSDTRKVLTYTKKQKTQTTLKGKHMPCRFKGDRHTM